MKYAYKSDDLCRLYSEMGLSANPEAAYQKFFREKNKGNFTPPQLPNQKGEWVFTEIQLKEIIKAFGPGGTGKWHFKT